ncbi:MAG TPA: hypothetical protein DDZ51_15610 [Planctomycetaceae bacterium]|nr:hypothetical protein [Planctomycetaceae bacterium]
MSGLIAPFFILTTMLFHPGHSTRVEVQYNAADQVIELAMRIDHSDLEAALRNRYGQALVIEKLTEDEARELIAPYLGQTLRVNGQKLGDTAMNWIGWERKRISSWLYVEIQVSSILTTLSVDTDSKPNQLEMSVLTLLEVEPELNHVVAVKQNGNTTSTVTSKQKPNVTIPIVPAVVSR